MSERYPRPENHARRSPLNGLKVNAAVITSSLGGSTARLTLVFVVVLAVGRLVGFGRESIIAYLFGTSRATDAYVAAIALPDLIGGGLMAGSLGYAIIPAYKRMAVGRGPGDAERWLSAAVTRLLIVSLVTVLLVEALSRPLIGVVAPGLTGPDALVAAEMLQITAPAILAFSLTSLAGAVLNLQRSFLSAPLSLLVGNSLGVAALVMSSHLGVRAAAIAYVSGSVITALVQLLWVSIRRRGALRMSFNGGDLGPILAAGALAVLVTAVPYARFFIERVLASTLPAGELAALSFATRIVLFVAAAVGVSLGTVAFPAMAEHAAASDSRAFSRVLNKATLGVLVSAAAVTLALTALAGPLVQLVYQRGAFGGESAGLTASIVRVYSLALVGMVMGEVQVRALFAIRQQKAALMILLLTLIANVALDLALVRIWGVVGLAAGAAVGVSLAAAASGAWLHRCVRTPRPVPVAATSQSQAG